MRFAFLSSGYSLWLQEHLVNEGHEVGVFPVNSSSSEIGVGYVKIFPTLPALLQWGGQNCIVIADMTDGPEDRIRIGPTMDMVRKSGYKALGGGSKACKLESDRAFGQQLAKDVGFKIPPGQSFNTISDAIDFLQESDEEEWHFKTDKYLGADVTFGGSSIEQLVRHLEFIRGKHGNSQKNHLEQTIKGPPLSINAWWNGEKFAQPIQYTIEHKRLLDGDIGPNTGCSFNICGPAPASFFKRFHFDRIEKAFQKLGMEPGLYDVNTITAPEGIYFLEWTPRFGYDSEPTIFTQVPDKGMFLVGLAVSIVEETPWMGHSYGVRLSVPPYPQEEVKDKESAKEIPVLGPAFSSERFSAYGLKKTEGLELYVADPCGLVGVAVDTRQDFETQKSHEKVEAFIQELSIPNLQYRTDGGLVLMHDIAELKRVGVDLA